MCCLWTVILLMGPRMGVLVWWLLDQSRWNQAFDGWLLPAAGFIFLPWTTMAYVMVFPGGVNLFDWVWLGLALVIDLASYGGGGYGNREKLGMG